MLFNSTDSSHDMQNNENKKEISNFRRALPQFCVVGVKNVILLGEHLGFLSYCVFEFALILKIILLIVKDGA